MNDDDRDDVTVSEERITVSKSLNTEEFQTLAIVLDVRSERDEPARVQLSDEIPDAIDTDDVGFHPEYGGDHWAVEGHRVVFERTFDPGEQYTTVYGIRDTDPDEVDGLLSTPDIDIIDGDRPGAGERIEDIVSEDRSWAVRDVVSGERDTLPGLEPGDGGGDGETDEVAGEVEPPDPPASTGTEDGQEEAESEPEAGEAEAGPEGIEARNPGEGDDPTGGDDRGDEVTVPVTGGVVRVLVKELREGTVPEEDRELLRDELAFTQGSTEARIEHLQTRVSDLEAYTDALEEFIDENGSGREVIDDLQSEMRSLRGDVTRIDDRLDDTAADIDDVESAVDDVRVDLNDLREHENRIVDIEETVEEVEDAVADLREHGSRIDGLEETMNEARRDIEETIDEVRGDVADLREERARIDDVEDRIDDVEDIADRIRTDLDDMGDIINRLSSVFGGGAGGPGGGSGDGPGGGDEGAIDGGGEDGTGDAAGDPPR